MSPSGHMTRGQRVATAVVGSIFVLVGVLMIVFHGDEMSRRGYPVWVGGAALILIGTASLGIAATGKNPGG